MASWLARHPQCGFALLSAAWVLLLYWRVLSSPFLYDDVDQIVNNPVLASFHAMFRKYFSATAPFTTRFRGIGGTNYRPVFWLSLSLDRHIWGLHPIGFHVTNVFLHWANGFLLYSLLRRLHVSGAIAAAAALIWLGMPINSEPVAWISGREYLLCGFFLLLALWSAHSYIRSANLSSLGVVLVSSLCALFSHESGILLLPLMILLFRSVGEAHKYQKQILISVVVISDFIFLGARRVVGASAGGGTPAIWQIGLSFWKYILWMSAPIHMSIERSTSTPQNISSPGAVVALCLLFALCVGIGSVSGQAPLISAGLAWTVVAILPFCGIFYIYQGMAERFEYFASPGLALAAASLVLSYKGSLTQLLKGIVILWVVWGAWRLKKRVVDWSDPISLYQSSVEATPDAILFCDLGWALRQRGELQRALTNYQEAARLRPDYQEAWASIGQTLSMLGRPSQALTAYRQALVLSPDDSDSRVDFALALESLGNREESEQQFRKALAVSPRNISALNNLGSLFLSEGQPDEAIPYFRRAIEYRPLDATAYYNLALLYQAQGQRDQALNFYQKVLQLNPNDQDALANVARLSRAEKEER